MPKRTVLRAREAPYVLPIEDGAAEPDTAPTAYGQAGGPVHASFVVITSYRDLTARDVQRALQQLADTRLSLNGGTMTGALLLVDDPTQAMEASTKQYVDAMLSSEVVVRNDANQVIFSASRTSGTAEFGPSTIPHPEYDGQQVILAGGLLDIAGPGLIHDTLTTQGRRRAVVSKSGNYAADVADEVIYFTAIAELTLPKATGSGQTYTIIANTGGSDVTVSAAGGETINGNSSVPVTDQNSVTVVDVAAAAWWTV